VDYKGEEFILIKVFNHSNISLLKIPYMFHPYETLTEKEGRLAHEEMEEEREKEEEKEEEEKDEMEIEEINEETSLESIEYPTNPNNQSNKTLLKTKRSQWKTNGFSKDPLVRNWIRCPLR